VNGQEEKASSAAGQSFLHPFRDSEAPTDQGAEDPMVEEKTRTETRTESNGFELIRNSILDSSQKLNTGM